MSRIYRWNVDETNGKVRKEAKQSHCLWFVFFFFLLCVHVNNLYGIECETHNNWLGIYIDNSISLSMAFTLFVCLHGVFFFFRRLSFRWLLCFAADNNLYVNLVCCWHSDQTELKLSTRRKQQQKNRAVDNNNNEKLTQNNEIKIKHFLLMSLLSHHWKFCTELKSPNNALLELDEYGFFSFYIVLSFNITVVACGIA